MKITIKHTINVNETDIINYLKMAIRKYIKTKDQERTYKKIKKTKFIDDVIEHIKKSDFADHGSTRSIVKDAVYIVFKSDVLGKQHEF